MYILFLDETGDHYLKKVSEDYPIFCLTGCIFDEQYYKINTVQSVRDVKKKYIQYSKKPALILHSRGIRKQEEGFEFLRVPQLREEFYEDLNNLIKNLEFHILASIILKDAHIEKYTSPSNPYHLSLEFIMERFVMFLTDRNQKGIIIAEARDKGSNRRLYNEYLRIKEVGTDYIKAFRFRDRILHMGFRKKTDDIAGLQVSDLINYPIGSRVAFPEREKIKLAYNIIRPKIFSDKSGNIIGFGLKIFPPTGIDYSYL